MHEYRKVDKNELAGIVKIFWFSHSVTTISMNNMSNKRNAFLDTSPQVL